MGFRFLVIDLEDQSVSGTNLESDVEDFKKEENYLIIDTEETKFFEVDGNALDIRPFRN